MNRKYIKPTDMGALRNYFISLKKTAEENEADQASVTMDLGDWQAQLCVRRKKNLVEKGSAS